MTACNIWLQPNAAHMVADGAMLDRNGRVVWIGSKIVFSEAAKFAIMAIGPINHRNIGQWLAHHRPGTQGELLGSMEPMARDLREMLRRENAAAEQDGTNEFILAAICWLESKGLPVGAVVDTGTPQALAAPFVLQQVARLSTPEADCALPHPLDSGLLTPDEHGLAVLNRQRGVLAPDYAGGEPHSIVGGKVEAVTISAEGCHHRVLHTWPDMVGERIVV